MLGFEQSSIVFNALGGTSPEIMNGLVALPELSRHMVSNSDR
jgi:hypothetical protein